MEIPYFTACYRGDVYAWNPCYYIRIDTTTFDRKPEGGRDAPGISTRIMREPFDPWDVVEIARMLSRGCSVLPMDFTDGKRSPKNWRAQQLFFIDIDNDDETLAMFPDGLREADAVERAFENDLPLVIAYQSFSGTESANFDTIAKDEPVGSERYRLVFASNHLITDRAEAQRFMAGLMDIYPEADECSKDMNRLFYGTDKSVYVLQDI